MSGITRSLVSCLIVTALIATTAIAQPIPANVLLNHDGTPFLQNEEQIWISRTDSLYVVADWRDWRLGFRRIGCAVSTDAGVTWGVDSLAVGRFDRQSDPCMTGDRFGTFYMNALDYESAGQERSQVSVWRSTNNGQSWTGPVATGPTGAYFEDKQFTTVDRTGSLWDGNYYMSWTRFPNAGYAVINFVRSTDGAQSFDPVVNVGPAILSSCGLFSQGQGSIPVVNADGSVHVFWSGFDLDSVTCQAPGAIRTAVSYNGGATFTTDEALFPSNIYFSSVDGAVDVYGFPIADADISDGPYDGTLYISHTQAAGPNGTDIELRKSTDNGASWSDPVTVNDDPPGQNIDQFHPWLTVNQDGVHTMVFYDQRTDPVNHYQFDCFFTASFDGAETFIHNYRVSEVSINPNSLAAARARIPQGPAATPAWAGPGHPLPPEAMAGRIGEYIGVHAYHDHVVAIWTDTRSGNQDAYSAQFEIPFMRPRLYLPEDGLVTQSGMPAFRWSTCWHEIQDWYRLELSADSTFGSLDYRFDSLPDNNFTPASPLATGDYFWRVKAFRLAGDSTDYSEVFRLQPACQGGAPPTIVSPGVGDTVEVVDFGLQWADIGDAQAYHVQLSAMPDFSVLLEDTVLTATELALTSLPDSSQYYWRVNSTNACGTGDWVTGQFYVELCPILLTGDVNVDGAVTASDIVHLVTYVFKSGSPPLPVSEAGDVNCDGDVDSADIIYLVNYAFKSGLPPCNACSLL